MEMGVCWVYIGSWSVTEIFPHGGGGGYCTDNNFPPWCQKSNPNFRDITRNV